MLSLTLQYLIKIPILESRQDQRGLLCVPQDTLHRITLPILISNPAKSYREVTRLCLLIQHGKELPLRIHILRCFLEPFGYTVDTLADEGRFEGFY